MIRINQIKLRPGQPECELEKEILKILHLKKEKKFSYKIVKRSIDARKKPNIIYSYSVEISGLNIDESCLVKRLGNQQVNLAEPEEYRFPQPGGQILEKRPVIIGTGPAGLFCGYMLALHGYRPILVERGMDVMRRSKAVEEFWENGILNTDCNVQFGEGGAGTFSDGKLNTLVKDKDGRNKEVLSIFVREGAPENILYDSKPHIGTDILIKVVKNMRRTIIKHGGEVLFDTKATDFVVENGMLKAIAIERKEQVPQASHIPQASQIQKTSGILQAGQAQIQQNRIDTQVAVLAMGHSARDTFEALYHRQVPMEAKSFAVGFRTEHPQSLINYSQYGMEETADLPPASYKLTAQTKENRGVYSFCMCPGGYVVDASSEEGRLAVNGMSYSKRDGFNANSAIIVSVTPEDYGTSHPLAGMAFQRVLEERAYTIGEGKVPVEYYIDFKKNVLKQDKTEKTDAGKPDLTYVPQIKGAWQFAKVHEIMPDCLNKAFVEGMEHFDKIIPGFASDHTILSGIESRTSSPVRIHRDESGQSQIRGLYPCGEGAGYAGGITSAAMDGIKTAELIALEYNNII